MTDTEQNAPDQDFAGVDQALRRAALRARKIAAQTGTPLVVFRHGRIEHEYVDDKAKSGEAPENIATAGN